MEVLVSSDPDTLDPRYVTDAVGMRVTRLVHAGLVRLDPDTLAPVPYAARGWRWIDERTLEVTLRDDVRFHSGAPLTARDVVATLRAFASPQVGSRHAGVVEAIASATEEGEKTVVVRLARPHATLLTDLELPVLRADQAAAPPRPTARSTASALSPSCEPARVRSCSGPPTAAPSPARRTRCCCAPSTTRTRGRCASRRPRPTWR